MTDYTLRARWIYLNEQEKIDFVRKFEWLKSGGVVFKNRTQVWERLSRDSLRDPDDIEDFGRMVATIMRFGKPVRNLDHIRICLEIDGRNYWVFPIQKPSDVGMIFRDPRKGE